MATALVRNGIVDIDVPTDDDAKQCARLLRDKQTSPNIRSLDLRRGVVTSAGAAAIAKALKGNSSLRHLGLEGNSVGDVGVAAIGRSIETNVGCCCALTSLDVSDTGITVVGLSNLVQGVSSLPKLHTLFLSDNNLAQEAGHQLSNLLKSSSSLHTVMAGGNYLGDRGLAAMCGAFCYLNPARVVSIDVSGNGIGDLGVQWLCKGISALCRNQNQPNSNDGSSSNTVTEPHGGIRDLRLRGNNITHAGAKDLANLLSEDRCARELRDLDLSLNTITADGFRPLATSLRGCRELVRLDVAGCRLGPGGVEAGAELIAAAGPKLSSVNLTPKAEFADRVLGDRGGLAVALRQSLERLADSLRFAGSVVEVGLGPFLRGDPSAAASIEETLRDHRARARVAAGGASCVVEKNEDSPPQETGPKAAAVAAPPLSRSNDKSRNTAKSGGGTSGSRKRGEVKGGAGATRTPGGNSSGSSRRTTPSQRSGGPTASSAAAQSHSSAGRSAAGGHSKESRPSTRTTGVERSRAGVERSSKQGATERSRRTAAGGGAGGAGHGQGRGAHSGASGTTPNLSPGPSSSLHRTAGKASVRSGVGAGPSSRSIGKSASFRQNKSSSPATLAALDKAAEAVPPTPRRRMHQGEELDSIDNFSPMPLASTLAAISAANSSSFRRTPPSLPSSSSLNSVSSASKKNKAHLSGSRPAGTPAAATAASRNRADVYESSPPEKTAVAAAAAASAPATAIEYPAGSGCDPIAMESIADVVSKVMGDTEAMVDQGSPPSVAPSTWEQPRSDAVMADGVANVSLSSSVGSVSDLSPPPVLSPPPASQGGDAAKGGGGKEEEEGLSSRNELVQKSSPAGAIALDSGSGEPELSVGISSLALTDERRGDLSSARSQETALGISSGNGAGAQQLVTIAEAGRMLGPLVAAEVEKEARKIEIRMQNEMNMALRTMRSEMEAIDREGLMARVAMEKRLKTGIKRLLDRIDHLDRRFTRIEREDKKRLALEAASAVNSTAVVVPPPIADGFPAGVFPSACSAQQRRGLPLPLTSTVFDGQQGVSTLGGGGGSTAVMALTKAHMMIKKSQAESRSFGTGGSGGGGGCEGDDASAPESRPLVAREGWGGGGSRSGILGDRGGLAAGGYSTSTVVSSTVASSSVASEEDFDGESGDDSEGDIVRLLEEKMAALEGKLLGHEERQRSDPRLGGGYEEVADEAFGQGSSAVWA